MPTIFIECGSDSVIFSWLSQCWMCRRERSSTRFPSFQHMYVCLLSVLGVCLLMRTLSFSLSLFPQFLAVYLLGVFWLLILIQNFGAFCRWLQMHSRKLRMIISKKLFCIHNLCACVFMCVIFFFFLVSSVQFSFLAWLVYFHRSFSKFSTYPFQLH